MKAKLISRETKVYKGWLEERYLDHYAQMGVDISLKLRNAAKDIARATYGEVPKEVEQLAHRFKLPPQGITDMDFALGYYTDEGYVPGSSQEGPNKDPALCQYIDLYPDQWEILKKTAGLIKTTGRHPCGFVITNDPIADFAPLTTVSDVRVTSFTAESVEAAGGLKMDFLVVNSIKDIGDCLKLIRGGRRYPETKIGGRLVPETRQVPDRSGNVWDIWDLPNDQSVFDMIANGDTETIFQFATEGALKWLPYFNDVRADGTRILKSIEDLSIFVALDRPGPLDYFVSPPGQPDQVHNALVEYTRRIKGLAPTKDIPEIMNKIVPETAGILIFQEGIQRAYQNIVGCSGSEAEEFRADIAKKRASKIEKAYAPFLERATKALGSKEDAQAVWDSMKTFSSYGFCLAHSVSYAVVAYACAYLKYHYPLEWWCAVLNNAKKTDIYEKFWKHVLSFVILPDIQHSRHEWYIRGDKIQAPLSILDGVGEAAHKQICAGAPYSSIEDFADKIIGYQRSISETKTEIVDGESQTTVEWARIAVHSGVIKNLAISGCLASIVSGSEIEIMDAYEAARKEASKRWGKKYTKPKRQDFPTDALSRYQARKAVLPILGEDLREMLPRGIPGLEPIGNDTFVVYSHWNRSTRRSEEARVRIISPDGLDHILRESAKAWCIAVVAHIDSAEKFSYGPTKEKTGVRLIFETGGVRTNTVAFQTAAGAPDLRTGQIVAAVLRNNNGPIVDHFIVIKDTE
jgi:hypothetical protein